jgi:hypothetical protein
LYNDLLYHIAYKHHHSSLLLWPPTPVGGLHPS